MRKKRALIVPRELGYYISENFNQFRICRISVDENGMLSGY